MFQSNLLVLGGLSSVLGLSVYGFYTFSKKKKKQCSTSTKKWYTSNKSQVLSLSLQKIGDLPRSKTSKSKSITDWVVVIGHNKAYSLAFSLQSVVSTKSRKNNKRQRSKSSKTSLKSKSTKKEASLKSKTSTLNIQK